MAKIDLVEFAVIAAAFGGLDISKAPALALLCQVVEEQAFCDGIRAGRSCSYGPDPTEMYAKYKATVVEPMPVDLGMPVEIAEVCLSTETEL